MGRGVILCECGCYLYIYSLIHSTIQMLKEACCKPNVLKLDWEVVILLCHEQLLACEAL